jgi:endonuclease YncB( thermonuclease family)
MSNSASTLLLAACLLAATAAPAVAAEQVATGRTSIVDADTLELHGLRMRLAAIDAPEARQTCRRDGEPWPCGRRAAFALTDLVGARPVTCR